jgi:hypothetical protein
MCGSTSTTLPSARSCEQDRGFQRGRYQIPLRVFAAWKPGRGDLPALQECIERVQMFLGRVESGLQHGYARLVQLAVGCHLR